MELSKSFSKKTIKVAGYVITAGSFLFLYYSARALDFSNIQFFWSLSSLCFMAFIAVVYAAVFSILPLGWRWILEFVDEKSTDIPLTVLYPIYTKANIHKYIPSNVVEFITRNVLVNKLGLKHVDIAVSSFIETLFLLLTAITIPVVFIFQDTFNIAQELIFKMTNAQLAISCIVVVLGIILSVVSFVFLQKRIRRLDNRKYLTMNFVKLTGKMYLLYVFVFMLIGLTFVMVFQHVLSQPVALHGSIKMISALMLAWTLGFITPGAPGGIGVREAVLLGILGPIYGAEHTLTASVIHRLISIGGDILAFWAGLVVEISHKNNVR